MAKTLALAGRIQKRNGQVMMTQVDYRYAAGNSQRWGMARFDCKSGRHIPNSMCYPPHNGGN